ncbi:hypothetical protein NT01EI_0709 [Edwardsiella ictaluri 93-146]|uniref:Uncharacterized protein n=1 Tax=Edwardsiella ictaluri (strain 93-146) TaxID=634503 RepID=C5B7Q3_EDWI9|nr:hypothetical protein NT01EI_0709 [Edwardsiella ictaluri 93-146]
MFLSKGAFHRPAIVDRWFFLFSVGCGGKTGYSVAALM